MEIQKLYYTPDRVVEVMKNIEIITNEIKKGAQKICLSKVEWVYPMSILPIAVLANYHNITIDCSGIDSQYLIYLKAIHFPHGTYDLAATKKNFLPITKLTCSGKSTVLSEYEDRILMNVLDPYKTPFLNGLKYLTSELESNVREHAKVKDYWILSQYWKITRTCEIAIADTGIGYLQSYVGTPFEVKEDAKAIENALNGKSSKDPAERGAGVTGIVKMFVNGYKGELIMMSGNALYYMNQKRTLGYVFNSYWQGSFIGLKFTLKNIDICKYY